MKSTKEQILSHLKRSVGCAIDQIADEFGLRGKSKKSGAAPNQRIGMSLALEEQAMKQGISAADQAIQNETIKMIEESMPKADSSCGMRICS